MHTDQIFNHRMSRKIRTQQKHILHLDATIPLPETRCDSNDALLSMIQTLKKEAQLAVGINTVARAMIQRKVAILLFACDVNPPELIQHLLVMAANEKIGVVSTNLTMKLFGQGLGIRGCAAVGVLNTARADLLGVLQPFVSEIPSRHLPFMRVETDVFVPKQPGKPR
jgi:ribosomal protein L7Ae-like RNA K-turn-binding protein